MSARVYRPRRAWAVATGVVTLALVAVLVTAVHAELARPRPHGLGGVIFVALFIAGFAALLPGALWLDRFVLDGDTIELRQLGYGHHRLRRSEIRGYRILPTPYVRTLLLERADGGKPVKYGLWIARDAELDAWLASLTDLDAADRAAVELALLADLSFGPTTEHRQATLERARRIARALNGIAMVAMLWAIFLPRPYVLVIAVLVLLPLVTLGLVATGGRLYDVEGQVRGARPAVALALILPSCALALRALHDVSTLDPWRLAATASIVTLTFAGVSAAVAAEHRARVLGLGLLLYSGYGFGVAALGNAMLDWHPRSHHEARVLDEHVTHGRDSAAYLRLDAWGPVAAPDDYQVSFALHDAVAVGDTVCIRLGEGALGARWYVVERCP